MKIEKSLLEDHQIQLSVEVDGEQFDKSKRQAARKISSKQRIPGFRPGKAPYAVIARQVGEAAIIEEAIDFLVEELYPKILDEAEVAPYGPGQLKEIKSLDPPLLEFVVPLAPEVELGDYNSLRLDYEVPGVTEEDIDQTIENLRARQAKTETVERAAQVGDMLSISLEGRDKNAGEEDAPLVKLGYTPVVIEADDADTEQEWPFPGFSNALKGLEKDGEAAFSHEYAEDYEQDDTLKGKSVEYKVTVHEVRARELPELTDDFAKSLGGDYENVADLREDARKHLESSTKEGYESDFENRILDGIVETSEFRFPPQMVEDEIDALVDQFKNRLSNEGWDLDTYLKANEKDLASLRDEFKESAVRRIRRGLVIMEVADKEAIKVSEREVQGEVQRTIEMVNASFPENESRKILNDDFLRGLVSSAMRDALTSRTFKRLKAIAKGLGDAEEVEETEEAPEAAAEVVEIKTPAAEAEEVVEEPEVSEEPQEETAEKDE